MVQKKSIKAGRGYENDVNSDFEFFCFSSGKTNKHNLLHSSNIKVFCMPGTFRPEIKKS